MFNYSSIFLLCFLVCSPVKSDEMLNLNLIVGAVNLIDGLQTYSITNNPAKYEKNPVLGRYPTKKHVITYFVLVQIIVTETSYLLPRKWGKRFLKMIVVGQFANVARNHYIGIRFDL